MGTLLASRIKNRRKELKMSQSELADGICKQGQISRLENGEYTPGSELLHDLSKKLNVSMDYFFDEKIPLESTELRDFKKIAKNFIFHRNYESLKYVYDLEKEKIHRLALSDKIYMGWIECLTDFYFQGNKEIAIEKLEDLLNQSSEADLNYLQISNTLFNFYYDSNNLERFKTMKKDLIAKLEKTDINTIEELELYIKINYNLGRYLWLDNDIKSAIKSVTETIKICKDYRSTYLLADLFLLLGNISKEFSDRTDSKEYYETAHFLYKLDNNYQMAIAVEHQISDMFLK